MKKVILFLFVAILATSCNAQEPKDKNSKVEKQIDSLNQPKGNWKVSKELDENGNIIRYDSIYSWSSSDRLKVKDSDSTFNEMQSMMQKRFSMFQSPRIQSFADHDSIVQQFFSDDFFKDDLFLSRGQSGFQNIDDMIKRMEAMRQHFFNDNYRYIIPPEEKKDKSEQNKTMDKKQV